MSATVDERVVEMRFDNKNFEKNVSTTMSTLDKLKHSLHLDGATKGLQNIDSAANRVNMSGLGSAVESVQAKFSALSVIGVTALANITNSAINTGKRILSALAIDPIKTGFQEYETQINAVQTILANTQSKGTTLDQVNNALDTLNTYADKTIYNFTEMTRNIGTFTAAGVDLDTAVNAIQGIANLAATSGSTSQQASTAMYQFSQAISSGTVKLQDWNSVVNAGMGGQVFQDALKETARVHGVEIDKMIKKEGSFRETLSKGWITSDILTETLQHFTEFTEDYNEETLKAQGYTDEQIAKIKQLGITGTEAATKVKTFTQLWDTLKEAAQSGWTQSWETVIGDFEEAKAMLTKVSDTMGKIIGDSADTRNKLLQGWKDAGGRDDLLEGFRNVFEGLVNIAKPVREAFRDIFPPTTVKTLLNVTDGFKNLTNRFKEFGSKYSDQLKRMFTGIFSIINIGRKILVSFSNAIAKLIGSGGVSSLGDFLLNTAANIGDFFTLLNEGFNTSKVSDVLSKIASGISDFLNGIFDGLGGLSGIFSAIGDTICKVAGKIGDALTKVFGWTRENISAGDIFAGLAGGGIFALTTKLAGFIGKIKETFEGFFDKKESGGGLKEKISDILGSVHDSLQSFTSGIKVASIVGIAVAIGILSASLNTIAKIDIGDVSKGLFAIGTMLAELNIGFRSVLKSLNNFDSKGIVRAGISLIFVATAVRILSSAIEKLSKLSLPEIGKGLLAVGGGIAELCLGLKAIDKVKVPLRTSIALLVLAESCKILGDAFSKFAGYSWGEIGRGLVAMGGALSELVVGIAVLQKFGGFKSLVGSLGILIAVQSLKKMADALKSFAEMNWGEIGQGLSAMGGALTEVGGITTAVGKISGFSSIFGAAGILITVQSLVKLASSLREFGNMSWSEIGIGLVGMGGALVEVAGFTGALGKIDGFSGILGSGAILLTIQGLDELADAFKKFGSIPWPEIGRGLVGMGGALSEVTLMSGVLGTFAGFSGILGGAAIWVTVQGLDDLANALKKFGSMNWGEIGRGLTAMGGALGEIAIGGFLNTLSIIGSFSISNIAKPLGDLADSVKKWSDVKVPIGLGFQLSSLAGGVAAFTYGGLGALAISEVAEPLGVMADSVRKWSGVTIPDGLSEKLNSLATGVGAFTFGGFGALTISEVADPLGVLADSVKKWSDVAIPDDLGTQLISLADGVKSFSFAFLGGWSIGEVVEPLTTLAGSVRAWNGISVPNGIDTQLSSLATGVRAFSFDFLGGLSISAVTGPLEDLATSVAAWKNVSVPDGLGTQLSSLAAGVKAFNGTGSATVGITALGKISSAAYSLSTIKFSSISSGLTGLGTALSDFGTNASSISGVGEAIVNNIVTPISNVSVTLSSEGAKLIGALATGMQSGSGRVVSVVNSMMIRVSSRVKSKKPEFSSAGREMASAFASGISANASSASTNASSMASSAASSIRGHYKDFYNSGVNLGQGFIYGLNSKKEAAIQTAYNLGKEAAAALKRGQKEGSPSKLTIKSGKYFAQGYALGMEDDADLSVKAAESMASGAINSLKTMSASISDLAMGDVDMQPTIRPVLDLSEVKTGAAAVSGLFNNGPTVGVRSNLNAINVAMNNKLQNSASDDIVSAINKLGAGLENNRGDTYNFGDFTYDDGSEVADAVGTLIRYAKIGRRV